MLALVEICMQTVEFGHGIAFAQHGSSAASLCRAAAAAARLIPPRLPFPRRLQIIATKEPQPQASARRQWRLHSTLRTWQSAQAEAYLSYVTVRRVACLQPTKKSTVPF
jgi:hypothetical protein